MKLNGPLLRMTRSAWLLSLLVFASCPKQTLLQITFRGAGLGPNNASPAIFLEVQFFDVGAGEPFSTVPLQAQVPEGIQDGDVTTILITPDQEESIVGVAAGAFSVSNVLQGAGRTEPVSVFFGQTNEVTILLGAPRCGDGFFDEEEELCDDAGTAEGCPDVCLEDLCGDGLTNTTLEECDFGDALNGALGTGCDTDCQLDASLVFGGRVSFLDNAPARPLFIPSGADGALEVAALDLNGQAQLVPILNDLVAPLGNPSDPLTATQRITTLTALELTQDSTPEVLLLDRAASELHIVPQEQGGFGAAQVVPLLDPQDSTPLDIVDLGLLPTGTSTSLLLLSAGELFVVAPSAGTIDLSTAARTPLSASGSQLLVTELDQDSDAEIAVIEGGLVEIFDTTAGVVSGALRTFSCQEDGSLSPLVDLDLLPLSSGNALLSTRADGRICVFQVGAPDQELKFFAASDAASAAVLGLGAQRAVVVGRASAPVGSFFLLNDLTAPTTFENISLSGGTGQLLALDLDGDQNDDLISTSVPQKSLTVFLGNPNGTLSVPSTREGTGPLRGLAQADLNNNGDFDLVGVSPSQVSLFLDAAGLPAPLLFAGPADPSSVKILDRDGDADADIAVCDPSSGAITILQGDGAGGISSTETLALGGDFGPLDIVAGNFDLAAGIDWAVVYDDLSTASSKDGDLLLYSNVGATLPTPVEVELGALGASRVDGRDLDFNFPREIIVNLQIDSGFAWITQLNGEPERTLLIEDGCHPVITLPGDLSEDNFSDVLLLCGDDGDIVVQNLPAGSPPPFAERGSLLEGPAVTAALGDLNRDGHLDVIGAGIDGGLALALGKGDGTFTPPFPLPGSQSLSSLLVLPFEGGPALFFVDDVAGLLSRWSIGR